MAVAGKKLGFRSCRATEQAVGSPARNGFAQSIDEFPIDLEAERGPRQLLAIAHEDAALAEQPERAEHCLFLGRFRWKKSAHQRRRSGDIRSRVLGHELAEGGSRPHRLP